MKTYLICYDLNKEGQNYELLIENIKKLSPNNWCHPLDSTWFIISNLDAVKIRDILLNFIDSNDDIFVTAITADTAWYLSVADSTWLKNSPTA